ncbi:MAG: hypothetical protein B7Z20_07060 [Sphingobium sp. 32-64-5]|nr:MAG: hypothetical protein B7Z20_07060 [Sphingobium sp. 32-64-5]
MKFSRVKAAIEGREDFDKSIYGQLIFHHLLTPETKHGTHYFATISRDYRLDDDALSRAIVDVDREIRMQDVVAAGQIEERLLRYPIRQPELLARADLAADKVRRRIQTALDRETGETGAAPMPGA